MPDATPASSAARSRARRWRRSGSRTSADAGDGEGDAELGVADVPARRSARPSRARSPASQAEDHERPVAEAVREDAGDRCDDHRRCRPGQQSDSRPSGESPRPICRNWAMRNTAPNRPAYMKKLTAFAAEKPRERNSRNGIIGLGARRSQATKAPISARPATSATTTSVEVHPRALARTSPQVMLRNRCRRARARSGRAGAAGRSSPSGGSR